MIIAVLAALGFTVVTLRRRMRADTTGADDGQRSDAHGRRSRAPQSDRKERQGSKEAW
jgi:hypothetical protein